MEYLFESDAFVVCSIENTAYVIRVLVPRRSRSCEVNGIFILNLIFIFILSASPSYTKKHEVTIRDTTRSIHSIHVNNLDHLIAYYNEPTQIMPY
jgi:hypothetical protein